MTLQFLPFIHFLNKHLPFRLLFRKMKSQYSLRPVECDDGFFVPCLSCGLDLIYKVCEDFAGEISASPVEGEFAAFFCGLEGTFVYVFQFGEGQLFLAVIKVVSIRAGRCRSDQWFMVTEDVFVIQIKIIVADADRTVLVFAKSIVKGGIQMVVLSVNPDNIPGVAVLDPFFRIVSADGDDAPDTKGIAEYFTDLAIPSQTPTPCPRGPMISWEYGFFSLS